MSAFAMQGSYKKKKKKVEETTEQKYNGLPCSIGRPYKAGVKQLLDPCQKSEGSTDPLDPMFPRSII